VFVARFFGAAWFSFRKTEGKPPNDCGDVRKSHKAAINNGVSAEFRAAVFPRQDLGVLQ
jgi:hypothetical protein